MTDGLRGLARDLGYDTGVARRSDLNPMAREHALVPGGSGQFDHRLLCGYGRATRQVSIRGSDCPRCLAILRREKATNDAEEATVTDFDWLAATSDPRVVAVDRARVVLTGPSLGQWSAESLCVLLHRAHVHATEGQARALLDAVAACDHELRIRGDGRIGRDYQDRLTAAVTAIVGEQP